MSLIRSLVPARGVRASYGVITFDEWIGQLNAIGAFPMLMNPLGAKEEPISLNFNSLVQNVYKSNGIVFACELARISLFSEARFQFRRRSSGRPGELFGTADLGPVEVPWTGGTTGDMLSRALQDADFGGTAFNVRRGNKIRRARPDWVTMIFGSENDPNISGQDLDADFLGILYHPGGRFSGVTPVSYLADDVAVFAPIPDPIGWNRGISWLEPVIRQVQSHNAATVHKLKFFENGATPQVVVSLDPSITDPVKFKAWVDVFDQEHKGSMNAYRTIYLGAGSKADVVGANLQQLDFKAVQGADETVIAAAAGVPAVVAGISEGLQGSSLNAGNFAASMRRFADLFARPAWRNFAGSLANIINVPAGAELWYDDRDIPALKDDIMDAAEVQAKEAQSIRTLLDAGFVPETVIAAINAGDFTKLKHTGLYSVQLQPPRTTNAADQPPAPPAGAAPNPPAAALPMLPAPIVQLGSGEVRCGSCDKLFARALGPGSDIDCPRCGTPFRVDAVAPAA